MESGQLRINPARWFWIASIWLGIGLFDATRTVVSMHSEGMHHAWGRLFFTLMLAWLPQALATPFVLRLGRRYPPVRLRPLSTWLVHLAACTGICLVAAAWTAGLEKLLNPWQFHATAGPFLDLWLPAFYEGLISYLFLYSSILAIGYVLESRERLARQQAETARLNEQLSRAQLDALRRQIEPHFLFNTLNAVAGLMRENRNDAAVTVIAALSDLLRRVVEDSGQEISLGEEMEFLQRYLDIQKVRFADRLTVNVNVSGELFPARVPSLVLQPMVENAIQHGIARRAQGGVIEISASRSNGILTLKIGNDGPRLTADAGSEDGNGNGRSGIGISNVKTRLQSLYGESFELRMQNREPEGVEVSISVPFREN